MALNRYHPRDAIFITPQGIAEGRTEDRIHMHPKKKNRELINVLHLDVPFTRLEPQINYVERQVKASEGSAAINFKSRFGRPWRKIIKFS